MLIYTNIMQERTYTPAYISSLPVSKIVPPVYFTDKLRYLIFKIYSPFFKFGRDLFLSLKILRHDFRQDYPLGKIKPEKTIDELITHLIQSGFGNHFIAWVDEGEVASLRFVRDFRHQYHLRIFKDGELRGHYEYTPEYKPISHLQEIDMTHGRELFLEVLHGWIDEA